MHPPTSENTPSCAKPARCADPGEDAGRATSPRPLPEGVARHVFDTTGDGVLVTDARARIVEVNAAFEAITGYARAQVLGRTPAMLASGRHGAAFYRELWARLRDEGSWQGELWNRRADGRLVAERLRISAVHGPGGELTHYVGVFSDLTVHKRQQARLEQLERGTHYDALTGLPNRVLALERLGRLIADAERHGHQVAVCCVDLDHFGAVNERIGAAQGDALLTAAARRIRELLRTGDTVARSGGDEFLLLLGGGGDGGSGAAAAVQPVLERMLHALAQPFALGGEPLALSASIGMSLFPAHGATPEQLLRAADQALYRAKCLGRNRVCSADDGSGHTPAQATLLEELREGLAAGQLCLHYQPKVCARTRRCLGVEALLRWQHPRRGLLAPGLFLPAVAGTPLELALDRWVLREAVAQLVRWRAAGRGLHVAVNLSPATLALPDLAGMVAAVVQEAAPHQLVPLEGIELEVLETAALEDLEAASHAIKACARQGISFALDDFGTGYSSLSYLQRLPVSTLKIDRSFVSHMLESRGDLHIVRAVIGLAEAFGVTTVAEGVETQAHARLLAELGCHQLQGYGIARPMPVPALEAWLDAPERSD